MSTLEQRQNRRCPVAEGANGVTVRIGTNVYQGDLLNVSAEGFAVIVRDMPVPGKNLLVELECMTGRHEARVTRWERIDGMLRLGLHRVRDILEEEPAPEPMPQEKLLNPGERPAPASLLLALSFGLLLLAAAVIVKFSESRVSLRDILP
jgi:hypothetical protein